LKLIWLKGHSELGIGGLSEPYINLGDHLGSELNNPRPIVLDVLAAPDA
jgi:hypothetical protein